MTIPTVPRLKATLRRLDRRALSISAAMRLMRDGALLCRVHDQNDVTWILGDTPVNDKLAADLLRHPQVAPGGDGLPFDGLPSRFSQTFHFVL